MSETNLPSIPIVPPSSDPALFRFLQAVRETMLVREGEKGNALDSAVTFRDLIDAGIAVSDAYKPNPNTSSIVDPAAVTSSLPPPDPINVHVSGAVSSVMLTWEFPNDKSNLAYVKVWRAVTNSFPNATVVGTGAGTFYMDYDVVENQNYYYWVQSISTSGIEGTVISAGLATAVLDPTSALSTLKTYGVEGLPYYYIPSQITINGVVFEKGTYLWNAVIGTASIGTAQIKDAAITSAKVSSLTANKITFNSAAGQVLTAAVINGAVITGTTSISSPSITGGTITGGTITGGTINGTVVNGGELYVPNSTTWKFKVDALGNTFIRSGTTGARLEIFNNVIKVYDTAGLLRVQIGDLSA